MLLLSMLMMWTKDDDAADNDDPGVPWTEDRIVSCGHREHTSHYPCLSARTDTIFTVLGRDAVYSSSLSPSLESSKLLEGKDIQTKWPSHVFLPRANDINK